MYRLHHFLYASTRALMVSLDQPEKFHKELAPLSPFLSILAMGALSRFTHLETMACNTRGIKLCSDSLSPVTHLLFACDIFLFAEVFEQKLLRPKQILETFQGWVRSKNRTRQICSLLRPRTYQTKNETKCVACLLQV